jgi:hypothetical protein
LGRDFGKRQQAYAITLAREISVFSRLALTSFSSKRDWRSFSFRLVKYRPR